MLNAPAGHQPARPAARASRRKSALASSTVLAGLLPFLAGAFLPGTAQAIPSIALEGDYIRVGVNPAGTLGSGDNASPGILYDGTGTGTFNPSYDYLTPGTPFEGFTISGSNGTPFSYLSNNASYYGQLPGTLTDYSGVAFNGATYDNRAVWTGSVSGLFTITNDYFFNDHDQQLGIATTITADTDLTGLLFGRYEDPDAYAALGDSSETNNFLGSGDVPTSDLVYAEALVSKYVIGLYTNSSVTHGAGISSMWSTDAATYLNGANDGDGDYAVGLGFDIGDLLSGHSVTLQYEYIFGTDIEAAVRDSGAGATAVNIETGTDHTTDELNNGAINPVFDGGTLSASDSGALTPDFTLTTNGGTVDTGNHMLTLTGGISGDGGLTKTGSGVLILSGGNSYTGGTTVAEGMLVGNTTSLSGPIVNNAALEFVEETNGTFSGAISGSGQLIKMGAGVLTLTGSNTATGGITVGEGTLVGNGGNLGGAIVNNATLVLDQPTDMTFSSNITGSGSFVKSGEGTVHFNSGALLTPQTIVEQGHLAINVDAHVTQVAVEGGASLGGNTTLGGLIVHTSGTAAPGNSIGKLTSATYVTFEKGSNYNVEVDADGHNDKIAAEGVATLEGGHVHVLAQNGQYAPATTYTILTANGGVDGRFEDVDSNLAFLVPTLSYTGKSVTLTLLRNDLTFSDAAVTANEKAAAGGVDDAFRFGSGVYMNLIGASAEGARQAFNALSGEIHASVMSGIVEDGALIRQSLLNRGFRLQPGESNSPVTMWAEGIGNWSDLDGNGNAAALDHSSYGFLVGTELAFGDHARLGLVTGYSDGKNSVDARASTADTDSTHVGLYGGVTLAGVSLRAGATHTAIDVKARRQVAFGNYDERLTGRYNAAADQLFGEAAYRVGYKGGYAEPFGGLSAAWVKKDAFHERGGDAALADAGRNEDYTTSSLGLRAAWVPSESLPVTVHASTAWQHALGGRATEADLNFMAGGDTFTVAGTPLEKNAVAVDTGLDWRAASRVTLSAGFSANLSDRRSDNAVKFGISIGL
jgi:outer membrane autotransporter protein